VPSRISRCSSPPCCLCALFRSRRVANSQFFFFPFPYWCCDSPSSPRRVRALPGLDSISEDESAHMSNYGRGPEWGYFIRPRVQHKTRAGPLNFPSSTFCPSTPPYQCPTPCARIFPLPGAETFRNSFLLPAGLCPFLISGSKPTIGSPPSPSCAFLDEMK